MVSRLTLGGIVTGTTSWKESEGLLFGGNIVILIKPMSCVNETLV